VDVVVHVLADNDRSDGVGVLCLVDESLVLELGSLRCEAGLDILGAAVLKVLVLDTDEVVGVDLWCDLTVGDGLDGGVEVVLVNLLIDGGRDLLVLGGRDGLVDDSRGDGLVDGRVVLARLGPDECVLKRKDSGIGW